MQVLIAIALKSLLVAGVTLGLLELMKRRSAAERSWIAHIGLVALVLLAFAPLVLPSWNIETPALFTQADQPALGSAPGASPLHPGAAAETVAPVTARPVPSAPVVEPPAPVISLSAFEVATALYAVPAALLLLVTFLALMRLVALRARADVLVDGHWLSALARAQRRMGFKHGTALLTSDELASPISWGLMRPVILLNSRAVEASGEAEAIIAHELAHVARLDWIKLLLARVATALFWFNPFVWMLAREAHQLREEAADDAVLGADIADTDYAQLLVGVARHDCPSLLLGAHGVAPSKSSLARRVARVLDTASVRSPAARPFALGVFVGAVLVAAPLAALTLTPAGTVTPEKSIVGKKTVALAGPANGSEVAAPTDLPHIIADGVSTSVATAVAAVAPARVEIDDQHRREAVAEAVADARQARADAKQARADAIADARDAAAEARAAARSHRLDKDHLDWVIQMKAIGIDANYVNAMRAVSPELRALEPAEFVSMKSVGVTPEYARALAAAGFPRIDAEELTQARSVGLSPDYARQLAAAGLPPDLDDYIQLRAVGVPARYVISIRKSGHQVRDPDKIVEMWAVGVQPGDLKILPVPVAPRAPKASKAPRAPSPPKPPPPAVEVDPDDG
jgi:beta-lactamase regulating signal transducer with metallopeptidase domain